MKNKHNARRKKVQARKNQMPFHGSNQPKRRSFSNLVVNDLKKLFKSEDETLLPEMDFDKVGVMAVFHHSNGTTNTLRALGAKEDAENIKSKINRNDALGFLCDAARKNNLIGNDQASLVLMGYAAHSQTYNMGSMMYDSLGLIMNFYIQGNQYTCRDCNVMPFENWVEYSRSLQLENGGENRFQPSMMKV